jgi:hypothetical protein
MTGLSHSKPLIGLGGSLLSVVLALGCGKTEVVSVDGSSTVFLI